MIDDKAFSGAQNRMTPGEDFVFGSAITALLEELDEDEERESYEPAAVVLIEEDSSAVYLGGVSTGQLEMTAWARVSMALRLLGEVLGGTMDAWSYGGEEGTEYWWRWLPPEGWKEQRL